MYICGNLVALKAVVNGSASDPAANAFYFRTRIGTETKLGQERRWYGIDERCERKTANIESMKRFRPLAERRLQFHMWIAENHVAGVSLTSSYHA